MATKVGVYFRTVFLLFVRGVGRVSVFGASKMALPFKRFPWALWLGLVMLLVICGVVGVRSYQASTQLAAAKKADNTGQYGQAQHDLTVASQFAILPSTRREVQNESTRNQHLLETQQKLTQIQQLLKEHKTAAAKSLLKSLGNEDAPSTVQSQVAQLQKTAQSQTTTMSVTHSSGSSTPSTGGTVSGGGGSSTGSSGGGSTGSGSGGSPSTSPMTALSIGSFTAGASPATASTCSISDSLTFSANGSGSVTATWSLFSTKSTSQTDNPTTFSFSSAGSQSDTQNFTNTQGLESGDSYRISVTITSTSNPSITTTAGPITISSCAGPPALSAEQQYQAMTSITPGTISVNEYQDGIFSNECSVQVTTPYSVNGSGTVEAIVMVTSGSSIGYTYYDANGASGFTGAGSTSDTSYFRLPHLPSGGNYTITVKLVEVSVPTTVYATTSSVSSGCA